MLVSHERERERLLGIKLSSQFLQLRLQVDAFAAPSSHPGNNRKPALVKLEFWKKKNPRTNQ